MGYREVMGIPIRAFWLLNENINRLFAETDIRQLSVLASARSSEGAKEMNTNLTIELGEVLKAGPDTKDERDQAGFDELKAMSGM